ncbi:MAG TPA: hypothetical protein VFW78_06085 [Bacteroidia bacterium]|nr:hypothetical protein [Bacteroidia bacterium]
METLSRNLTVEKTARYWVSGNDNHKADRVVILLHGYGMSAKNCLSLFQGLAAPGTLLVAPEGLSRFYSKGFFGDVVASWMTREERTQEIADQMGYLDRLVDVITGELAPGYREIIVIGYSQGVATGSRWIKFRNGSGINKFVAWAGEIAPDVLEQGWPVNVPVLQVFSVTDNFISAETFQKQAARLEAGSVSVKRHAYEGIHEVLPQTVLEVADILIS